MMIENLVQALRIAKTYVDLACMSLGDTPAGHAAQETAKLINQRLQEYEEQQTV